VRDFASIAEFVRFLETRVEATKAAQKEGIAAAGEMLEAEAKAMIGAEDPDWPPLADSTVADKQRLGYVDQVSATDPLLRTGELRDSIEHSADESEVVVGSNDEVAVVQELGNEHIPARSFIGATMFQHGEEATILAARFIMTAFAGSPRYRNDTE
jgi:phage gpG-like protein